jgi:hypothetical protein
MRHRLCPPRDADRLVYFLILLVFAVGMFEWFWLDRFLKVFDIIGYLVDKGRVDHSDVWMDTDLAMNAIAPRK